MEKLQSFVEVAVRLRKLSENSIKGIEYVNEDPPYLLVAGKQKPYYFDNIFNEQADQESVFNSIVKPRIHNIIDGYNCTIFAYGQTGTGKSYTMGTDYLKQSADMGLIPRIFEYLFLKPNMEVCISYFEVYNSKFYDLLCTNKSLSPVKTVQQLTKEKIINSQQAQQFLHQGCLNRRIASTKQNLKSSRSHAILTIYCCTKSDNLNETLAKLNLVDLAGLESVKKAGSEGMQFEEGVRINKDLLSIGKVLNALSTNQMYIPYRDSTLTNCLKDSLNANNYVTFIACISSNIEDVGVSMHTLEIAENAKGVRIEPELNVKAFEDISNTVNATPGKLVFNPPNCSTIRRQEHINYKSRHQSLAPNSLKFVPPRLSVKQNYKIAELKSFLHPNVDSPKISRRELKHEISRLVKDEISQFCLTHNLDGSNCGTEEIVFKKPKIRPKKTKVDLDVTVRRSLRLSLRNCTKDGSLLEEKPSTNKNFMEVEIAESKIFSNSSIHNETNNNTINNVSHRRSTRLLKRNVSIALEKTIEEPKIKNKRLESIKQKDRNIKKVASPQIMNKTSMESYILNILNNGDEKKLQTLQTIGAKTAKSIYLYRKMHGIFKNLTDLSKFPWKGDGYQRFLTFNLL